MHIIYDQYNGAIIEHSSIQNDIAEFEKDLLQIISDVKNKRLLWITLDINKSNHIPILTKQNFIFHHCDEFSITLIKKLTPDAFIPIHTNHAVGVGGLVILNNKVLMIKDRINERYKLPGGYVDNLENITIALEREIFEETGITAIFSSIIGLSHYANAETNISNIYIICEAIPQNETIDIQDSEEIIEAKWVDIDELFNNSEIHEYNKTIIKSALKNSGVKILKEEFFTKQGITMEHFFN